MVEEYDCNPHNILAGIGPAIGPCCYEVGAEVAARFCAAFPYAEELLLHETDGHVHLDLWEANRQQLLRSGVLRTSSGEFIHEVEWVLDQIEAVLKKSNEKAHMTKLKDGIR